MRALIAAIALTAAAPAAAQDLTGPLTQFQIDELRAQQQLTQQRAVALQNEISAMDARLRAEQALRDLEAQRAPAQLPQLPYPAPPVGLDVSRLPQIPDAALAASNRRVQAAAQNRR